MMDSLCKIFKCCLQWNICKLANCSNTCKQKENLKKVKIDIIQNSWFVLFHITTKRKQFKEIQNQKIIVNKQRFSCNQIYCLTSTDNPENTDKNYLKVGRDKTVSPLADVWSMGVVLYGMLVETLPFNANTKQEIIAQISKARLMIPKNLILNYLEITKIAYTHSRTRSQKENYFN
ncbi:unnamed protein product [Paramecium octaurelia]|uniref:Protein kinase domain-containing protein n=1 Tax=Paramecium octaurelia TaxID=43137 RepID=A0A8S1TMW8_PAROT|nr:unnamed protein product [Paramecium octaurelia]